MWPRTPLSRPPLPWPLALVRFGLTLSRFLLTADVPSDYVSRRTMSLCKVIHVHAHVLAAARRRVCCALRCHRAAIQIRICQYVYHG